MPGILKVQSCLLYTSHPGLLGGIGMAIFATGLFTLYLLQMCIRDSSRGYKLVMLGRNHNRINAYRLAVIIVFNSNLALGVGTKISLSLIHICRDIY